MKNQSQDDWSPPPDVTRHDGAPIEPEAEFFAPTPREIGPLISADSTLRRDKRAFSLPVRVAAMVVPGLLILLAMYFYCTGRLTGYNVFCNN